MKRNTHVIVPGSDFQLLQGEGEQTCYQVRGQQYTGSGHRPLQHLACTRQPDAGVVWQTLAHLIMSVSACMS
jgi:hypothetical protein